MILRAGTRINGCAATRVECQGADATLSNGSHNFFHFVLIILASAGMVYLVFPDSQLFTTALYGVED